MIQRSLHSTMIQFALEDSLFESEKRFEANDRQLSAFQRSIENGAHRNVTAARLKVAEAELSKIANDQERLEAIIPELKKTGEAFRSLSGTEKTLLHRRLANPGGELKLVLQRRNGELLAS